MKSKICVPLFLVCATVTLAAADWPQWRGPNRDNQSAETGLYGPGPPAARRCSGRRPWAMGTRAPPSGTGSSTSTTTTWRRRRIWCAPSPWPREGRVAVVVSGGHPPEPRHLAGPCPRSARNWSSRSTRSAGSTCSMRRQASWSGRRTWSRNTRPPSRAGTRDRTRCSTATASCWPPAATPSWWLSTRRRARRSGGRRTPPRT